MLQVGTIAFQMSDVKLRAALPYGGGKRLDVTSLKNNGVVLSNVRPAFILN